MSNLTAEKVSHAWGCGWNPKEPERRGRCTCGASQTPSPALLRQWAADPSNTLCWGLSAVADRLERTQKIIEDFTDHQQKSCRDVPASETGFCYCGLSAALKEAGL